MTSPELYGRNVGPPALTYQRAPHDPSGRASFVVRGDGPADARSRSALGGQICGVAARTIEELAPAVTVFAAKRDHVRAICSSR